jgi:hypothetical protein
LDNIAAYTFLCTVNLLSAYDKSKRKHALSLKKLEAQITQLVAQHERDVSKHSVDQNKHEELANNRSVRI